MELGRRRSFRKLFKLAGFNKEKKEEQEDQQPSAHPHRFRHTYAVELLQAGVPIDRVAVLLGHSSVKITERHYLSWVKGRQEQLEADVRRAWTADPIARNLDTNLIQPPAAGLATGRKSKKIKEVKKEIEWWRRRQSHRARKSLIRHGLNRVSDDSCPQCCPQILVPTRHGSSGTHGSDVSGW